jgi:hypothetical protein
MEIKGKAYANRKEVIKNDLYHTPQSLTWKLTENEKFKNIDEPACGEMAIVKPLEDLGYTVNATDLTTGHDFLKLEGNCKKKDLVTNPPFFIWDDFVLKSKELGYRKTALIGRTNYLGTYGRYENQLFSSLKYIYVFNRYVDYQTPLRDDGLFHVGALCTGWFVWEAKYKGLPQVVQLDVQEYAKLGSYDPWAYKIYQHLGIQNTWTPDMEINSRELMLQLQDSLNFKFTQKELNSNCSSITKLVLLLKRVNKERTFENLENWSRV